MARSTVADELELPLEEPAAGSGQERLRRLYQIREFGILAAAIGLFVALDAPGLDRNGVPVEQLAVERTELRPGEIELHVRNDGPDAVEIRQAIVNDAFVAFEQDAEEVGRLSSTTVTVDYPWIEGQAYEVALLTATGGTITHEIDVAAESPESGAGFFGVMALIGLYVGIIPVAIGMLWLPWLRRLDERWVRLALAVTVGLLAFLGLDALRLHVPVGPGDTIRVHVTIAETRPTRQPDRGIVRAEHTVRNQDGTVVMSFQITRMVQRRGADGATPGLGPPA